MQQPGGQTWNRWHIY